MDCRHESLKEGLLNHLITTINTYMLENIDTLVIDETLLHELAAICQAIYRYLGVSVDTSNILSRHNLLSKDVVVFPEVPDPEANKILSNADFGHLIFAIQQIAEKKDDVLSERILRVIDEYQL